jgi:hypothetical protein
LKRTDRLKVDLKRAATPKARALMFRTALAEADTPTTPAVIARAEKVSEALVSKVLQWRSFGGPKVRRVQEHVARVLQMSIDAVFPNRGPAVAGGGRPSQRRTWDP